MPAVQCGITCSGSLGEEVFAIQSLLNQGKLGPSRPHGSLRARLGPTCEGVQALPRGGTFLEIGANNGFASNTRYLEHCLGWRGVLVEGHPANFRDLVATRPGSLSLGTAVCAQHGTARFSRRGGPTSGIVGEMSRSFQKRWRHSASDTIDVPCGPLRDWLALLRLERVDYVSLDVEGAELLALSTLDWERFSVGVLIAECSHMGCTGANDRKVAALLRARGLQQVATLRVRHDIWDAAFANASWVMQPA